MTNLRWKKPVDGDFADAARWKGDTVPGPADEAILGAVGAAFTVSSSADVTVAEVRTAANATLAIDAGTFTVSGAVNAGVVEVGNRAALAAQGMFANSGVIALVGVSPALIVGAAGLTLTGAGQLSLNDNAPTAVYGAAGGAALTNVDNTIAGAGHLGDGDMGLVNEARGVIDATGPRSALFIDTGANPLTNAGLIETTGSAGMTVASSTIANSGTVSVAGTGALILASATVTDSAAGAVLVGADAQAILKGASVTGGSLVIAAGGGLVVDSGTCTVQVARFENAGAITIESGAFLDAQGTLRNNGAILIAGGNHSRLIVGEAGLELTGGGTLTLTDIANNSEITGEAAADNLTNVDNTISGGGQLGAGQMTLLNAEKGLIDATGAFALIIDVGLSTVVNAGRIESTGAAGAVIESAVSNGGLLEALGGRLTLDGAVIGMGSAVVSKSTLDFESGFDQDVAFKGRGTLILSQSQGYTASISGFSAAGKTTLDLRDIGFVGATEASFSGTSTSGVLTVSDGTHTASLHLTGDYLGAAFTAADDGRGGTSVVANATGAGAASGFAAAMAGLGRGAGEGVNAEEPWRDQGRIPLIAPRAAIA